MEEQPDNSKRKPLVSVEFQTEVDLATGHPERRMFVKMYFDARDSGLLADIGDRRWRTVCALATYMDEKGCCYPSQARIAKDLGTTRESVNRRVQELLAYRFQGRPVVVVQKARLATPQGGRWANNVYQILPVTGFQIFGDDATASARLSSEAQNKRSSAYVTKSSHRASVMEASHRPVYEEPNTRSRHTNQNQSFNKTFNVTDSLKGKGTNAGGTPRDEQRAQSLALEILEVCRDTHSVGSYLTIARVYPEALIYEALSLTKDHAARGRITKSRGAYFTDTIARLAKQRGL
jgi:biotin operon repressor